MSKGQVFPTVCLMAALAVFINESALSSSVVFEQPWEMRIKHSNADLDAL